MNRKWGQENKLQCMKKKCLRIRNKSPLLSKCQLCQEGQAKNSHQLVFWNKKLATFLLILVFGQAPTKFISQIYIKFIKFSSRLSMMESLQGTYAPTHIPNLTLKKIKVLTLALSYWENHLYILLCMTTRHMDTHQRSNGLWTLLRELVLTEMQNMVNFRT